MIASPMQGQRGTPQSSMDNFRSGNAKRPARLGSLAVKRVFAYKKAVAAFQINGVLCSRESPTMSES